MRFILHVHCPYSRDLCRSGSGPSSTKPAEIQRRYGLDSWRADIDTSKNLELKSYDSTRQPSDFSLRTGEPAKAADTWLDVNLWRSTGGPRFQPIELRGTQSETVREIQVLNTMATVLQSGTWVWYDKLTHLWGDKTVTPWLICANTTLHSLECTPSLCDRVSTICGASWASRLAFQLVL